MKKTLIWAVLLIAAFSFQNLNAQVKGGFKLGADFSTLTFKFDGEKLEDDNMSRLISPRLGFIVEVPVNDFLFVQTGLFATAKGFRTKETGEITIKQIELLGAMDIPVNFGYKYDLGNVKLFGMAGPVLSYNFYTTWLYKVDGEDWDNDNDDSIGNSDLDTFKPLNFGLNLEAGVEVSSFQFSFFFTQGLSNLSNMEKTVIKSNVFGLAVAIKFGRVN